MGWATNYINSLNEGNTVRFRPRGNSMTGIINSGDLVEVIPMDRLPEPGDVVLCKVKGKQYLHLVRSIRNEEIQIMNNKGFINGWTSRKHVYGRVVAINPKE